MSDAVLGTTPAPPELFADFAPPIREQSALRRAITASYRRPERECVAALLPQARVPEELRAAIRATARTLVEALRAKHGIGGLEDLIQEYDLSSQEGVALMCLAEALLRIPDAATRDALIRDKIAPGDWWPHLGIGRSLFVNAATWGLIVTGKLTSSVDEGGLSSALTRTLARFGEPVVRRGVGIAMEMLGEQFVAGETIKEALRRGEPFEEQGFRYSYDMLGEAAMTAADAQRYHSHYEAAIHAIGAAAAGRGIYDGAGISIKLSALHPRYARSQAGRVMDELLPRLRFLARLAKDYDIGLNIDAEEADRLELSLDLLESLCFDPDLSGWNGLGFVVQAYGKRCPEVIDYLIDLATRAKRRLMVRLVKGAYWDAEIKRAQVDGQSDFPVYTRKIHTDISYIACARKLLAAPEAVFPQFATHNAQTLATIYHLAGKSFRSGQYEFQCLHGMGEPLYEEVVDRSKLARPVRIYAPVGSHETLLAYLVRRLLENGANSSFVNRIADPDVSVEDLIADPAEVVAASPDPGAPHPAIKRAIDLYGSARVNSLGLDLTDEAELEKLQQTLSAGINIAWHATSSQPADGGAGEVVPILNPADHRDAVGTVVWATAQDVEAATTIAQSAAARWAQTTAEQRAACLRRAADMLQERMPELLGLIVREAGKSLPNAIGEVREAIDFLRYYASQAIETLPANQWRPLGTVLCISPWNFPLAIFTGQVAAGLAAGNCVIAKPAEETPLIAAEAVRLLHAAGIPEDVLLFVPGDGDIGSRLVASAKVNGVLFTGSTEVARLINLELALRTSVDGRPIPLIAETGGQNALVVDSSALPEQVVADALTSAFDSAGQRCSALRVLCLQEEIADRTLVMLKGALRELSQGRTDCLAVDVGPVITAEAKSNIERHIEAMRRLNRPVLQMALPQSAALGHFVPPTIIELETIGQLQKEVFGPVLHVVRYRREKLDELLQQVNATGYALTFGLHTRIDETIAHVREKADAGNIYINRNMIGAVVGVQPFGGSGLSGTGPKAGGPLYLSRLGSGIARQAGKAPPVVGDLIGWMEKRGHTTAMARWIEAHAPASGEIELQGPVGERNLYLSRAKGDVLLFPVTPSGLFCQLATVLATGGRAILATLDHAALLRGLPASVSRHIEMPAEWRQAQARAALIEGDANRVSAIAQDIARCPGPIILAQAAAAEGMRSPPCPYDLAWLMEEISVSINTTASGGNATLMTLE